MSVQAKIYKNIDPSAMKGMIPLEFRTLLGTKPLRALCYTVLCFPGKRNHSSSVVNSASLLRALRKLAANKSPLVVIGYDFTVEAREILADFDATIFSQRDFSWTDESWARLFDPSN